MVPRVFSILIVAVGVVVVVRGLRVQRIPHPWASLVTPGRALIVGMVVGEMTSVLSPCTTICPWSASHFPPLMREVSGRGLVVGGDLGVFILRGLTVMLVVVASSTPVWGIVGDRRGVMIIPWPAWDGRC